MGKIYLALFSKLGNFGPKIAQNNDLSDFSPNYVLTFIKKSQKSFWFVEEFERTLNLALVRSFVRSVRNGFSRNPFINFFLKLCS